MQDPRTGKVIGMIGLVVITGAVTFFASRQTPTQVKITDAPAATPGGAPDILSTTPVKTLVNSGASTAVLPSDLVCYVHVAGAVRNPGLYHFTLGSRIAEAVHAAGGGTGKADMDAINLAEPLADGEKVYVPERQEPISNIQHHAPGNSIGHVTIHVPHAPPLPSPTPVSDSIKTSSMVFDANNIAPTAEEDAPAHRLTASSAKLAAGERINLNTASVADLERLPGIGPATAAQIIDFRTQNGGFRTLNDLMSIKGIGEKKLAKLSPFVML